MRVLTASAAVLIGSNFISGCATLASGDTQTVSFISNPEGATIELDGRTLGKAPLSVTLKKKSGQWITAKLDGYKAVTIPLETRLDGMFWGNIVFGGFIGSTTDEMSGAAREYIPSHYMITLPPLGSSGIDAKIRLSDDQKIKEFVVVGYRQIIEDLRKGQGEYRDSLLNLLNVPKETQDDVARKIKALSDAYPDIPEFAQRVLDISPSRAKAMNQAAVSQPDPSAIPTTFHSPPRFYDALCAQPLADILAIADRATSQQREALLNYIVDTKRKSSGFGWTFVIRGDLKPAEKECINLFLRKHTAYKPVFEDARGD